jgi:peroxiredoxin
LFDHERSLVNKFSGKPFALIGVNAGDSLEKAREVVKTKELNWRSFFDGDSEEITGQYAIEGFPTVFLIDQDGVIRHRFDGVNPEKLDAALNQMMAQAK